MRLGGWGGRITDGVLYSVCLLPVGPLAGRSKERPVPVLLNQHPPCQEFEMGKAHHQAVKISVTESNLIMYCILG